MKPWGITENVKEGIRHLYLSGKTLKECAVSVGCSYPTAQKIVKAFGLTRSRSEVHRIYAVNEDYFANIDTEDKAYWLGFILADGNVSKDGYVFSVTLSRSDRPHLIKLRNSLQAEHPIVDYRNESVINIGSQLMVARLNSLGVIPNKSLVVRPELGCIPCFLERHFWRGTVDGDGHLSRQTKVYNIGLSGTTDTVSLFLDFIRKSIPEAEGCLSQKRADANFVRLNFNGLAVCQKISYLLYHDSSTFLDRKKELYLRWSKEKPRADFVNTLSSSDLKQLYSKYGAWYRVAFALGVTRRHLSTIQKKLGLSDSRYVKKGLQNADK
jgi:hypothetical protein